MRKLSMRSNLFQLVKKNAEHHGSAFGEGGLAARRQRSEQYLTCSQSRSHFLRQAKGRAQCAHCFVGSSDFFRIFMRQF